MRAYQRALGTRSKMTLEITSGTPSLTQVKNISPALHGLCLDRAHGQPFNGECFSAPARRLQKVTWRRETLCVPTLYGSFLKKG